MKLLLTKTLCTIVLLLLIEPAFCQKRNTDSLWQLVIKEKNDSTRFGLFHAIRDATYFSTDETLVYAQKEIKFGEEHNDKAFLAIGYTSFASLYSRLGDKLKAQEAIVKASKIVEQMDNNENYLAAIYNFKGNSENDVDKSLEYLNKGIAICRYDFFKRILLFNAADGYLRKNLVDSALANAQRSNEIAIKYHDTLSVWMPSLFGRIYLKLNQPDIAYAYFKNALKSATRVNNFKYYQVAYYGLITYFSAVNNNDSLLAYNKKLFYFESDEAYSAKVGAADFLYKYYLKKGDKDSLVKYLLFNKLGNDSLNSNKKIEELKLAKIKEELRQNEFEASKEEEKSKRSHNLQLAFIAIGILSVIIIFLLLSNSFIVSHKLVGFLSVLVLLVVFEFINLLIHPFLEKITHHSPVLMLLGLVALASLIIPLHHKIEHWATSKLVEKNKAIRLAQAKKTIEELEEKKDV